MGSLHPKKKAISSADIVICISENTKKDLLHFYPQFSNKDIRVIYNGVSSEFYIIPELRNANKTNSFILFVGSRADYKNFTFTVKAVAQTTGFFLEIVGTDLNDKEMFLLNKLLPGRWKLHANIDSNKLNILYNKAFALMYPSLYEGFGIPILEAMKAGCPFIAINSSSIPEVAGNAGVLLEGLSYDEFNLAINHILKFREEIIEIGIRQSMKFSWERCHLNTLNIYKELSIIG